MLTRLTSIPVPPVRFGGKTDPKPVPRAEGPIFTLQKEDEGFLAAGRAFAEALQAGGYSVTGLFDEGGVTGKDFVMYTDRSIGGKRFLVDFHHDSLHPRTRQEDFKEALDFINRIEEIECRGEHSFRFNGADFYVTMQFPSRPPDPWGYAGNTKRAVLARKRAEASGIRTGVITETQAQAELLPAVQQLITTRLKLAGIPAAPAGSREADRAVVTVAEQEGLHGKQLLLKNARPERKDDILDVLKRLPGIRQVGSVSFIWQDIYLSLWTPPVSKR